jgi:HK97 family phage major capsid protein
MGAYLDRLNSQFDEIRTGIDELVNRAADENRDVTADEQTRVDRDNSRMDELTAAIEHYSGIEKKNDRVTALRSSTPGARQAPTPRPPAEDAYDVAREFSGPGDYAVTLHRATMLKNPEAADRIARATAHQKTTDNPGLIPRPVLGPIVDLLNTSRPFVNSCVTRPLPAGSFDRPTITQHVAVGEQAAEKDLTASQVLTVGKIPVTAHTFAGHLNIVRLRVGRVRGVRDVGRGPGGDVRGRHYRRPLYGRRGRPDR